ncbi:MAG: Ldh family oxidoreductase [Rhodospirillales bacterium]|nr:Ldh family oxidoreductase [Rhodospirillales bacterium]
MSQTITIPVDEATRLSVDLFVSQGMSEADATASVWPLIDGEMMGIATHGLIRVPAYAKRLRIGGIDAKGKIAVERRAPSLALVDGGNATGTAIATRALDTALEMVAESGIAFVGCRHSNHCGALIPYGLKAVEAGYIMVGGTNASTTMPPWGGAEARIGNNPICFAAPVEGGEHFLLDMAMSVAARGKIRAAQTAGEKIPAGWAVDDQGRPTTDPAAALKGFLSPMGGHKGSGMSQAIDILCGALNGAQFLTGISSWLDDPQAPSNLGHFFLLLDPGRLIGKKAFSEAMARFRNIILTTPPADPKQPVMLPGQREQQRRRQAIANGMAVPEDLVDEIKALAG